MTPLSWFVILVLAGLLLIGLEIFIPGGIIGTLGVLAMIAAIILAFTGDFMSHTAAMVTTFGLMALTGFSIYAWLKYFPKSRAGKDIFLSQTMAGSSSLTEANHALLGQSGVAVSVLKPSGYARIGNKEYDVITEGTLINKEDPVTVVKVEGSRIVVRKQVNS
jgi:membrane-bound serine protease (ClpP class)